jgi:RTX calcium-binding nonapeptide repeat (4 copies)
MRHTQRLLGLGVGVLLAGGALNATPALASASSSCTYDASTHQVTAIDGEPAGQALTVTARYGGYFYVTDAAGSSPCKDANGNEASVWDTDKVVVKAATPADQQQIVIDEWNAFEPGFTKESDGQSEIETYVLTGTGGDRLTVLEDHSGHHNIRLATNTTSFGPAIDLNGDGDYDLNMTSAGQVKVVGSNSHDDRIDASAVSTFPVELDGGTDGWTCNILFCSWGGDDVLIGGSGSDTLYGNGHDHLYGGPGADTLQAKDSSWDYVDGGADYDMAQVDTGWDTTVNVERLLP